MNNFYSGLIFHLKSSDNITDVLISLHWLRVPERIHCKLAVMAYKVLLGRAPSYLGQLVRFADVSGRRALRSAGTNRILVPPVGGAENRGPENAGPKMQDQMSPHENAGPENEGRNNGT